MVSFIVIYNQLVLLVECCRTAKHFVLKLSKICMTNNLASFFFQFWRKKIAGFVQISEKNEIFLNANLSSATEIHEYCLLLIVRLVLHLACVIRTAMIRIYFSGQIDTI